MWFKTATTEPEIDYVERVPHRNLYKNRADGSTWYVVTICNAGDGVQIVTSYEVTADGSLLYRTVNGLEDIFPTGRPAMRELGLFLADHDLLGGHIPGSDE